MIFKLTILEFFVRVIPEAFFLVLAGYAISRVRIEKRKYVASSCILSLIGFTTRLLPIEIGIHSILNLIGLIIVLIFINRIDTIKAITSAVIIFIILTMLEGLLNYVLVSVLNKDLNLIMSDANLRLIYGIPSFVILAIIGGSYYFILSKAGKLKNVSN